MKATEYVAFVGFVAILFLFQKGVSAGTVTAVAVMAVLAAIPWYFGTRNRSEEPSRSERFFAALWAWFRRVVGLCAGVLFLWAGWGIAHSSSLGHGTISTVFAGIAIAGLGLFCLYIGIVGQGRNRADCRDDVALHNSNKHRYKWWF